MIKRVELEIGNGFYTIVYGDVFGVECEETPFLCYEENDVWHAVSSPETGENCNAVITLRKDIKLEEFSMRLCNGAAKMCSFSCGTVDIEMKNARVEFEYIKSRRMNFKLGKGSAVINAQPLVGANFECGFGDMLIFLKRGEYKIKSTRGNGRVSIDSSALPREFMSNADNGINVNLRCGLGNIDVNFI